MQELALPPPPVQVMLASRLRRGIGFQSIPAQSR